MKLIERLVRHEVQALTAYHVPPAKGLIKLDAMENPYSLPDQLRDEWLNNCLLYTSPSPRDGLLSRMPSSA